jgi:alcohol dehydrogenase class IV
MIPSFNFAKIPQIIFGPAKLRELYDIALQFGKNILLITGKNSLKESGKLNEIISGLNDRSLNFFHYSISGEPSPTLIDEAVKDYRNKTIDVVLSIGGGSVIDTGKAISAMLLKVDSIKNYLEGVGDKAHDGTKIPFIAVPTTSGTGSEATKNAVISEIGPNGFKKSLRHDNFIPEIALIDPELMISCPPSISAACGMDAFTQLIEAYVSTQASPMTDALAVSGMKYITNNLLSACSYGSSEIKVRASIAYASLLSGITLANAGLGVIHGLASAIGGLFDIPHGVVCGTLLAEATRINIKKLNELGPNGNKGLKKYGVIGSLLSQNMPLTKGKIKKNCLTLIETLERWTKELKIERLRAYGIKNEDLEVIIERAGQKNNPVELNETDIRNILLSRL